MSELNRLMNVIISDLTKFNRVDINSFSVFNGINIFYDSYIPPAGDGVTIIFDENYSSPSGDAVNF